MSNVHRHRGGNEKVRFAAVDSSTVIEIGDDLWLDTDDVKPASDFTWDNSLGDTQAQFSELYAGVALSASADGDTEPVRIGTDGIYEKDCSSSTFEAGDFISQNENDVPDGLLDQEVVAVDDKALATGVVAKREPSATSSVFVEIHAPVWRGLNFAPVNVGDSELGQPMIINAEFDESANQVIFDGAVPRKIKIVDTWAVLDTAGGSSATLTLTDGTDDITDALDVGDGHSDGDVVRAGSLDNDYATLSVGDDLEIDTGGTQGSLAGEINILAIPVE